MIHSLSLIQVHCIKIAFDYVQSPADLFKKAGGRFDTVVLRRLLEVGMWYGSKEASSIETQ